MKFDSALPVLAVSLAPVAALGQLPYVGGGGGSLPDVGGAADLAKPGQVTGQLNGLLEGQGLNSLDLSQVLTIDWDNDKELLNLLGTEGQGKINVLASKDKSRNATDEEKANYIRDSDSAKEIKQARDDYKKGKLNFFYAYGMQAVKDVVQPKWVLVFDNAFTATGYFGLVQDTYKDYYDRNRNKCSPRPSPQVFIYPHGVGPAELEGTKKFDKFTGKVFFQPIASAVQLPVIPHQDVYGYLLDPEAGLPGEWFSRADMPGNLNTQRPSTTEGASSKSEDTLSGHPTDLMGRNP
ncbi:hypothetical protein KXV81_002023 [Aspergillus fumigatus]|nr:hypothetical protein CNMCM8714_000533 [Aspergillus fumigatus]KAF4275930.1 hypothetical protein CNMCM8812_007724 [Aspergillus fumigatus]KAH1285188.1 hypothetical protein KXX48_001284 [Aspergillus fumigatus]KAH1326483.1 hypothetical protein KXX38_005900 [Aspergillus fumigatus]KAH1405328.1 hypothetical protein KXX51_009045 [Aspergillus fumigatus]